MRVLEITGTSTSGKKTTLSVTAKGSISGERDDSGHFIARLTECSVTVDGEAIIDADNLYLENEKTTDLNEICYHDGKSYQQLGALIAKYGKLSDFRVSNTEVSGESGKIIETLQETIDKIDDAYKAAFGCIAVGDTVKARKVMRSMIPAINALYNVTLDGWDLV